MKYFSRFIKRLCYRFSKRLIRLLIFFHLLFVLLVSSVFAQNVYEYADMQTLADGGTITTYIGNTPEQIDEVKYTIQNFQSWNDITITDDNTFKNASIKVSNAPNIDAEFLNGNVVYLRQKVVLNVDKNTYTLDDLAKKYFYLTVGVFDSNNVESFYTTKGVDIVSKVETFHRTSFDEIIFYLDGFVRLPNFNGTISSLSYNFDNMSTGTLRVRIYPQSSTSTITYFVGDIDNAPSHSSVDTDNVDDYHNKENQIINGITKPDLNGDGQENDGSILDFFDDFRLGVTNFFDEGLFPQFALNKVFTVWSYWFNNIVGYRWFKVIVYPSIVIGLFAFTFSILRDGLSGHQSIGKDKSNKTSISRQRYTNLGG